MLRPLRSTPTDEKCIFCKGCDKTFSVNKTTIRGTKKENHGLFCGWCGKAVTGDKK